MKRDYGIDFVKFVLMIAMVFRHAPLYFFDRPLVEYSIRYLTPYSLTMPVTIGFISVLGISLGISKSSNSIKNANPLRYLKQFYVMFFLALVLALISFVRLKISFFDFFEYFFMYERNTPNKPGFYILFPIALLYLYVYCDARDKFNKIYLFVFCLIAVFLCKYYWSYYFLAGVFSYWWGYRYWGFIHNWMKNKSIILFSFVVYFGFYFWDIEKDIGWIAEYVLFVCFFAFFYGVSSVFIKWKEGVKSVTAIILYFYIVHVMGLNILATLIPKFHNWLSLSIFCILYSILIIILIMAFLKLKVRIAR